MSDGKQIKALLSEGALYVKHGLFPEARDKFTSALKLIKKHEHINDKEKVIANVLKKISLIDKKLSGVKKKEEVPVAAAPTEIPDQVKEMMSRFGMGNTTTEEKFIDTEKVEEKPKKVIPDEEIIEINSIALDIVGGEKAGDEINIDVISQTSNVISILVPIEEEELLKALDEGIKLKEITCFSSAAIFSGYGIVSKKNPISSGPKKGSVNFDIRIKIE